jgi:hypothetical protein
MARRCTTLCDGALYRPVLRRSRRVRPRPVAFSLRAEGEDHDRWCDAEAHWRPGRSEPRVAVKPGAPFAVKSHVEAVRHPREREPAVEKRKGDLPAMGVTGEGEIDPAFGRVREAIRIVREEDGRDPLRPLAKRAIDVVALRPGVVDPGEVERRAVVGEHGPLVPENARSLRVEMGDERLAVAKIVVIPIDTKTPSFARSPPMTAAMSSWKAVPLVTMSPVTTARSGLRAFAAFTQRSPRARGVIVPMWRSERCAMR